MNLALIQLKNETEDLLLSITKNFKTFIKQTNRKPEETLEFKITKPRKTFHFNPSINLGLDSNWMVGLTSLKVYNSILNITEENNKFELYTDSFDEVSFEELKMSLRRSSVFQILHHIIYNMKNRTACYSSP